MKNKLAYPRTFVPLNSLQLFIFFPAYQYFPNSEFLNTLLPLKTISTHANHPCTYTPTSVSLHLSSPTRARIIALSRRNPLFASLSLSLSPALARASFLSPLALFLLSFIRLFIALIAFSAAPLLFIRRSTAREIMQRTGNKIFARVCAGIP